MNARKLQTTELEDVGERKCWRKEQEQKCSHPDEVTRRRLEAVRGAGRRMSSLRVWEQRRVVVWLFESDVRLIPGQFLSADGKMPMDGDGAFLLLRARWRTSAEQFQMCDTTKTPYTTSSWSPHTMN
ncbi:unnamed protein product [Heligmosomoides polygyrus]|uniref:Uncharacterized protein n=1 Tax=Heligmosomoides polygyrus TaxID=6339 RepID=A0A183FYJ9_HELPZ|nr:unnamed protein product [Heligmosomoides polygyrus]